jgi:hypothetical protein
VTCVDVYGDVRSSKFSETEARRLFLDMLQGAYEDDARVLRQLRTSGGW